MKKTHAYRWSFTNLSLTKLPKIIKLTATLLLFVCTMSVTAGGFSQDVKVNLSLKEATLTQFFKAVEKETKYRFAYSNDIIPQGRIVNIRVKQVPLSQVLYEVFSATNLKFRFVEESGIFIISEKPGYPSKETVATVVRTITGTVTNEKGEPLSGVTVQIKGASKATTSSAEGSFSIEVPDNAKTLVFSFVGMVIQEVSIQGKTSLQIVMQSTESGLDEVVVVGYGTQKKKAVMGAISRVSSEEITALSVSDPRQALQGRVPGLTIVNNGSPGESPIVRIRGIGSINYASDPFYVIDGFPGANLGMIDARDIESIDVLRDAAASAIYGSRGANGVVIVTTKKGSRSNKLKVGFDGYYGVQTAAKKLDLLTRDEYIRYGTALKTNAGSALPARFSNLDAPVYPGADKTYRQTETDWQDEVFNTAPITQATISLSNGSDNYRYYISGGYTKQEGIMIGTGYQRFNVRFNGEYNLNKVLTFGHSFTTATEEKMNELSGGDRTQVKHIISSLPYMPVYDPTLPGGYRGPSGDDGSDPQNPVRVALFDSDQTNTVIILGTAYLEAKILSGLTYRFTAGINHTDSLNRENLPIYNESFSSRALNSVKQTQTSYSSIYLSNQVNYQKSLGEHNFAITAIAEKQNGKERILTGSGFYNTNELREVSASLVSPGVNGGLQESVLYSYIGRVNYDYKEKYFLSGTLRRDGSSVFAPGNKWANFPSISAGWRVAEENFMRRFSNISELKLRGSWGRVGFNGIPNYAYQFILNQNASAQLGSGTQPGAFINTLGNDKLKWEITEMYNAGVDIGLWGNKVLLQAEYYNRKTDGLILNQQLPGSIGYSRDPTVNAGTMENKGFEFQVTYYKKTGDFRWDVSGNISTVKNKVLSFGQDITSPFYAGASPDYGGFDITRTQVGDPVQSFFGYRVEGIFQNQAEIDDSNGKDGDPLTLYQPNAKPGDIKFRDLDGNGTISGDDREVLGSFIPKFSYGFNYSASYRNFEATLFFQGVQGNKVYNGTKVLTQGMLRLFNSGKDVLNAWTPENTNTNIPRAVEGDPNNNSRTSDRFLESGSYLRLKTFTIGYVVPSKRLSRMLGGSVTGFKVYISAQNLLTFTEYSSYDPEVGSRFNAPLRSGIDYGQFPSARTFLFGVKADF
ncbi:MAG: SusC/RagA family TonB-linked outer membrane protein [Chitinophagaceae bacterium]|nr:SusC/RagA family TonB-linked outer membrane protein [Chitinophagaceae bacterium]